MKAAWLSCCLLAITIVASAHRLDEYLQATRVSVATHRIDVSFELTPGVAVADQVLAVIDADRDGRVSDDERAAYARSVLTDLRIGLDEKNLKLGLVDVSFPALHEMKSGIGIIRVKATTPVEPLTAGQHTLSLTNTHLPKMSVYLVNALVPKDRAITITRQTRDELQKGYRLEFGVSHSTP